MQKFLQLLTPRSILLLKQYKPNMFFSDLSAGISVSIVALPLAMAFAIASGVGPEKGLFTAIIAGFLISFLGGSRYQIGGPTGAFVVVLYVIIVNHGYDGLIIATIIAGIILIFMGVFRLGNIIKFIPYPVTVGFTSGIALIIFTSQIKDFFGLNIDSMPADFVGQWKLYFLAFGNISFATLYLSILGVIVIITCKKFIPKIPGPMVAIVILSFIVYIFNIPIETIGSKFGPMPSTLPSPSLPAFSLEKIQAVFPDAITIALLGAIESLLSAVVADGMTGDRHQSNRELIAQGTANIASVAFGGISATGAIARTVTNIKAGAFTPLSGMFHSIFLLLFIFFLSDIILLVPLCALASILVVVAWNMSEFHHFKSIILNSEKYDVIVLVTTFLLTVFINLNTGVQVGVMLSALLFIKRMANTTTISSKKIIKEFNETDSEEEEKEDVDSLKNKIIPESVEVYEINGPFFFGVADRLKRVMDAISISPKVFILRMRRVPMIDESGYHALEEFYELCKQKDTILVLSGVSNDIYKRLEKKGFSTLIGEKNVTNHIDKALERAVQILENK